MTIGAMSTRGIYWVVGVISLVLSLVICAQQAVVNPDAICYLLSANEVGAAGLSAAMHLCGQAAWPFYSVMVYAFSKVSFLSVTTSAYILDAVLTSITVLSFVKIVEALGGTRRVMWLAAFAILSAHQFNSVRQYIVRDHGFWAFYLLSVVFLLSFLNKQSLKTALGFGVSLAFASLFRIEGAVFLALLPMLALAGNGSLRVRATRWLMLNSVGIAAVLVVSAWVLMHPQQSLDKLGRLPELLNQFFGGFAVISERFVTAKTALIQHLLPYEAARDAGMVWAAVMIALYFANIINNLSWVATLLVCYAWLSGVTSQFTRHAKFTLFGYLAINLTVMAIFFAERMFFSKRYLIALTLILLLWVPFALDKLLRSPHARQRVIAYLAMIALFASSLGVVTNSGASKNYLRDAGEWLAANVSANDGFYANDIQLAYYSKLYGNDIFAVMRKNDDINVVQAAKWQPYTYAALRLTKNKPNHFAGVIKHNRARIVKQFQNQSGDQVIIYKIPRQVG